MHILVNTVFWLTSSLLAVTSFSCNPWLTIEILGGFIYTESTYKSRICVPKLFFFFFTFKLTFAYLLLTFLGDLMPYLKTERKSSKAEECLSY